MKLLAIVDCVSRVQRLYPRQGSKIVLVRSYLRVSQAAGQVNILIFLLKIKFSPCMPINFVMQGKCLFSDISRPARAYVIARNSRVRLGFKRFYNDDHVWLYLKEIYR